MQGVVKFFHDRDKYGFIEVEDEDDDVFFHITNVESEDIAEDDEVEFETEQGDKGLEAVDVTVL